MFRSISIRFLPFFLVICLLFDLVPCVLAESLKLSLMVKQAQSRTPLQSSSTLSGTSSSHSHSHHNIPPTIYLYPKILDRTNHGSGGACSDFSSSSLHSLKRFSDWLISQHPRVDVWLIHCAKRDDREEIVTYKLGPNTELKLKSLGWETVENPGPFHLDEKNFDSFWFNQKN